MKRLLLSVILVIAVLLTLASTTIYLSGRLGFRVDAVISDSMKPTLDVGAMIISKKVSAAELKVNDVIVFNPVTEGEIPIVHRIVEVIPSTPPGYNTRGDNPVQKTDPWTVPFDNVIGKMEFSSPVLGYYTSFARSTIGLILTLILPALLIIVLIFRSLWRELMLYFRGKMAKEA